MSERWSAAACERITGHAYRINLRHGYWRCVHCGATLASGRAS